VSLRAKHRRSLRRARALGYADGAAWGRAEVARLTRIVTPQSGGECHHAFLSERPDCPVIRVPLYPEYPCRWDEPDEYIHLVTYEAVEMGEVVSTTRGKTVVHWWGWKRRGLLEMRREP